MASSKLRPFQIARTGNLKSQNFRQSRGNVGVADRGGIHKPFFEVRPDRYHVIESVTAAEAAVHSLSLLQASIGNFYLSAHWGIWDRWKTS